MLKNLTWLTYPDIFENEDFFSDSAFCTTRKQCFRKPKSASFQKQSKEWSFLNACLLFSC